MLGGRRIKRRIRRWLEERDPAYLAVEFGRLGLSESGWIESRRANTPVDRNGAPLPWITYAAFHLLEERLPPSVRVFEYGAGYSTLWWGDRSTEVIAVEHDATWAGRVREWGAARVLNPANDEDYLNAPLGLGLFDVVVIDGRMRVECSLIAPRVLTEQGVILWDNTDRANYKPGLSALREQGFRRLDLWGPGPVNPYFWSTSILYRGGNILGL